MNRQRERERESHPFDHWPNVHCTAHCIDSDRGGGGGERLKTARGFLFALAIPLSRSSHMTLKERRGCFGVRTGCLSIIDRHCDMVKRSQERFWLIFHLAPVLLSQKLNTLYRIARRGRFGISPGAGNCYCGMVVFGAVVRSSVVIRLPIVLRKRRVEPTRKGFPISRTAFWPQKRARRRRERRWRRTPRLNYCITSFPLAILRSYYSVNIALFTIAYIFAIFYHQFSPNCCFRLLKRSLVHSCCRNMTGKREGLCVAYVGAHFGNILNNS